ncbi:MAG TPA: hypothetical protein VFJ90_05450 [Candidatus Didemnitutus sp.]|nr:hypothetical protein [Candidatus Didemnitutus sp.]
MKKHTIAILILGGAFGMIAGTTGCQTVRVEEAKFPPLVGAWRSSVLFKSGTLAAMKDMEFMYVFNAGGTMTESSSYDQTPPVPPAYGIWRLVSERQYEARYEFYWTKPPGNVEELSKGGGWLPGGHGEITQQITLSEDGNSFESVIRLETYDQDGRPTEEASMGTAQGQRIKF